MAIALSSVAHPVVPVRSTQMLNENFGERLARLRERSRLTQAQLAEAAGEGVTEAWIAAAERGRIKNPASERERIQAIARVLGVQTRYLTEPLGIVFIEDETDPGDWRQVLRATPRYDPERVERAIEVAEPYLEAGVGR